MLRCEDVLSIGGDVGEAGLELSRCEGAGYAFQDVAFGADDEGGGQAVYATECAGEESGIEGDRVLYVVSCYERTDLFGVGIDRDADDRDVIVVHAGK